MRFARSTLLVALSAPPVIFAFTQRCGTNNPPTELKELHASHAKLDAIDRLAGPVRGYDPQDAPKAYAINTHVHIVNTGPTPAEGNIPQNKILEQIQVLNDAYDTSGFTFELKSISRTTSAYWQNVSFDSPQEIDMKSTLRRGAYKDLNIYFTTLAPYEGAGILGYATFPEKQVTPRIFALDGALMAPDTIPGGPPPYNLGITTVHEVGHWLGLLHTFHYNPNIYGPDSPQGCAKDSGDQIFDTPSEKNASFGCQPNRDSCTGESNSVQGKDPVHNYMDYSDDACLTKFTGGQNKRMANLYEDLRITPGA